MLINELPENKKKIIKSIHLGKDRLGYPINAFVVYARSIYDYTIPTLTNRDAYIRANINKLSDDLDRLIYDVVRKEYPYATPSASFMESVEQREQLKHFYFRNKKGSFRINISPDIKFEEALKSPKSLYPAFFWDLRLYYPRTEDDALYNSEGGITKYTLEEMEKYVELGKRLQREIGSLEDLK